MLIRKPKLTIVPGRVYESVYLLLGAGLVIYMSVATLSQLKMTLVSLSAIILLVSSGVIHVVRMIEQQRRKREGWFFE